MGKLENKIMIEKKLIIRKINGLFTTEESKYYFDGNTLEINSNKIIINTNLYRFKPLYYHIDTNNDQVIFADSSLEIQKFGKKLDQIGAIEYMLFDTFLLNRTLYKEIKQIPAATRIEIDIDFNEKIDYFTHVPNLNIVDTKKTDYYIDLLSDKFSNISKEKVHMGLSGGLDSRLTLGLLKKNNFANVNLFTFAKSENDLEYKYAKLISKKLGYTNHNFYTINDESYIDNKNILKQSLCNIGVHHSHTFGYLNTKSNFGTLLSTTYTDALFGWASSNEYNKENTMQHSIEQYRSFFQKDLFDCVIEDINIIYNKFLEYEYFTNVNEFYYVMERNNKFHNHLTYMNQQIIQGKVLTPYLDNELFNEFLPLQAKSKYNKNMERLIVEKLYDEKIPDISSSWQKSKVNKAYSLLKNSEYIFITKLKSLLHILSNDKIIINSKYEPEDHIKMARITLYPYQKHLLLNNEANSIFSDIGRKTFSKKPIAGNTKIGIAMANVDMLLENY
jgi:hypothetical protein